jgi:hypothetical protein
MNIIIKVETTEDKISCLDLKVEESKLYIYTPNNIRLFDVIALVSTILSQHSSQILQIKGLDYGNYVDYHASGISMSLIDEVIFKVEPEVTYVKDDRSLVIDMCKSGFSFVPPLAKD